MGFSAVILYTTSPVFLRCALSLRDLVAFSTRAFTSGLKVVGPLIPSSVVVFRPPFVLMVMNVLGCVSSGDAVPCVSWVMNEEGVSILTWALLGGFYSALNVWWVWSGDPDS